MSSVFSPNQTDGGGESLFGVDIAKVLGDIVQVEGRNVGGTREQFELRKVRNSVGR